MQKIKRYTRLRKQQAFEFLMTARGFTPSLDWRQSKHKKNEIRSSFNAVENKLLEALQDCSLTRRVSAQIDRAFYRLVLRFHNADKDLELLTKIPSICDRSIYCVCKLCLGEEV